MDEQPLDETTRRVVELYAKYPYPSPGAQNAMFRTSVLPFVQAQPRIESILDAGCGTGNVTREMARELPEARVVGIDLTPGSIEIASREADREGLRNVEFKRSNLLVPDPDLGVFDFVHCRGVVHSVSDPEAGLRTLRSYLRPGGYAYVWMYMLLGRRRILHVREMLGILGVNDAPIEQRLEILLPLLSGLSSRPGRGRSAGDEKPSPLRRGLGRLGQELTALSEADWRGYGALMLRRVGSLARRLRSPSEERDLETVEMADRYLHPFDLFHNIEELRALFQRAGFSHVTVSDGMSDSLEASLGPDHPVTKLAANLSREQKLRLIELIEEPAGAGFLLQS